MAHHYNFNISKADRINKNRPFPSLRTVVSTASHRTKRPKGKEDELKDDVSKGLGKYYAVKFYPYLRDDEEDCIFAVVGGDEVYVARTSPTKGIEILQHFQDDRTLPTTNYHSGNPNTQILCAAAWSKDLETGQPLLCIGGYSGIVKVLNVIDGTLRQELVGHGSELLDLQISPTNPTLLASSSADSSIRIWSLDKTHEKQPCAAILAGNSHREHILSIAYHKNGKYLLSGGMDHLINMWIVPDLPDATTGTDNPTIVEYPHFSTAAIHSNYVDCVAFHNDLIISKSAAEFRIVLWRITNFSSALPPLPRSAAPTAPELGETRSAYGGTYERLLQLHIPFTDPFYMQFGLFQKAHMSTLLAMGTTNGLIYFWDLGRFERTGRGVKGVLEPTEAQRLVALEEGVEKKPRKRAIPIGRPKEKESELDDPQAVYDPHLTEEIPVTGRDTKRSGTTVRQCAWSPGGRYMIAVGDDRLIAVFERDLEKGTTWEDGK
ncbi:WD40 repeat-like protein [Ascobolus immersus RN42]|uniref:WD40 repeat-like protein n=1 Tax=Ascobolus immersus RN42 TaxID=1160509 RepID=A0A3N4IPZ4_ASCIM|nr:WD40 repeat-like protein [Ascobolus immersus RN42]